MPDETAAFDGVASDGRALRDSIWPSDHRRVGAATRRRKLEPPPKEVLDEFIQAAKHTPEYQWYSALPYGHMKDEVAKWEKELGYRLVPDSYQLRILLPRVWFQLADGVEAQLSHEDRDSGTVITLFVNRRGGDGRVQGNAYPVREADLDELGREVLFAVEIKDPLSTRVERFSAQNEPLSVLFNRLCTMGNASSSYRQDLADKIRITLDVRGKTVMECLTVLARTAGGQALFVGRQYNEPTPLEKVDPNVRLRGEDLLRDQTRAAATQPAGTQTDPADTFRNVVRGRVESMQKDRPVIILRLPVAGE